MKKTLGNYVFPRDSNLPSDAYRRLSIPWGWMALLDLICAQAKLSGCSPGPATEARLMRAMASFFLLDRLLDDSWHGKPPSSPEAVALYHLLIEGNFSDDCLPEVCDDQARMVLAVRMMHSSLTTESIRSRVSDNAKLIGDMAPAKIAAADIYTYVRVLIEESRQTALLITNCYSAAEQAQAGFESYRRWCILFTIGAALADSAMDLGKDRRLGRVSFTSVWGRPALAALALTFTAWLTFRYPIRSCLVGAKAVINALTQSRWRSRAQALEESLLS